LFMRRVEAGGDWSLFDPKSVPALPDLYGPAFEAAYEVAEAAGLAARTVSARDLYARDVRGYLEFCADQRLVTLGMAKRYGTKNPLSFMDLQDVQEITNFFERRVSAYQVAVSGEVAFDAAF